MIKFLDILEIFSSQICIFFGPVTVTIYLTSNRPDLALRTLVSLSNL